MYVFLTKTLLCLEKKEKLYFHCGPSKIKTKVVNLTRGKIISIKKMGI